ncbi:MAG: Abi family protein [Bacteroides sp.]|nr:Abi family protein [Eubacterium sp.]MCM1418485.1 Abi family protein [Roseburia sp.]MCM1462504.1 Abi family protein [Bacteroides sp.]
MAVRYSSVKNPATIRDQIEKLKSRGLVVEDEERAAFVLANVNYYRLVHYFSAFLENKHRYRPGTSFGKVMRIYDFDRLFRSLLLAVLEEIEISLRAHVSNYHAMKYGALGYLNEASYDLRHNHKTFLKKLDRVIEQNTGEAMVTHHIEKYGGAFPLWVIMELFSFGSLNAFFFDLKQEDRREIASRAFGLPFRYAEDWLDCLSLLRNHCAHYNRLYANRFGRVPKQPADRPRRIGDTPYDYILVAKRLYPRPNIWGEIFLDRLKNLFAEYADAVEPARLGFPDDWEEELAAPLK